MSILGRITKHHRVSIRVIGNDWERGRQIMDFNELADVEACCAGIHVDMSDVFDGNAVDFRTHAAGTAVVISIDESGKHCRGFVGDQMYPFAVNVFGGMSVMKVVDVGENPLAGQPMWGSSVKSDTINADTIRALSSNLMKVPYAWRFRSDNGVLECFGENPRVALCSIPREERQAMNVVPVPLNKDRRKFPLIPPKFING